MKSEHTYYETRIAFSGSGVFSIKFMKWAVSLIYDSCFLAIGFLSYEGRRFENGTRHGRGAHEKKKQTADSSHVFEGV